jgi:hypothetical protein
MSGPDDKPDDLERLARQIGQYDPLASRFEPAANENRAPKPDWRSDLFLVALLAATLIGAAFIAFFH